MDYNTCSGLMFPPLLSKGVSIKGNIRIMDSYSGDGPVRFEFAGQMVITNGPEYGMYNTCSGMMLPCINTGISINGSYTNSVIPNTNSF